MRCINRPFARRFKWISAIFFRGGPWPGAAFSGSRAQKPPAALVAKSVGDENEFVARLTGAKECEWLDHAGHSAERSACIKGRS